MCCSIKNGDNLHLNMYAKVGKPKRILTKINHIYYDVESYQGMPDIVDFTDVGLKH